VLRRAVERLENTGEGISGYRRGSLKLTPLHRKEDTENILIRLLKKDPDENRLRKSTSGGVVGVKIFSPLSVCIHPNDAKELFSAARKRIVGFEDR
jgi:hypothetical protein